MKAKYGICDEDVYNFDEAGFMIGKITTQLVVIASERKGRPKAIQPNNREWVTAIAAINAAGWSVPPFLIFAGQHHLSGTRKQRSHATRRPQSVTTAGRTTS